MLKLDLKLTKNTLFNVNWHGFLQQKTALSVVGGKLYVLNTKQTAVGVKLHHVI